MTGDNYRQRAAILSNASCSSSPCGFFVLQCSSARGRAEGTMVTMKACQIGRNTRSRGGCTEVLLIVWSPVPCIRTHITLWASAGSLCWRRWSHHLHNASRVQGKDIGGLAISCCYISLFYPVVLLVRLALDAKSAPKKEGEKIHTKLKLLEMKAVGLTCKCQICLCGPADFYSYFFFFRFMPQEFT